MSAEPVARKSILSNSKSPNSNSDIEGQQLYNGSSSNSFHADDNDSHPNADDSSNTQSKPTIVDSNTKPGALTTTGLKVLALLAFQNAFKNLLMRFVMKDHGGFLLSTAVIVVEVLKLFFSTCYIVFYQKQSALSIVTFIRSDWKNTLLLIVPATSYSLQMSLEYIAMANIDPASFSVLVQMKMLTTAMFFRTILKKRLMKKQFISLVILTVGVMLCSMKTSSEEEKEDAIGDKTLGIAATLGKLCKND
jgi:UDP-sugar transporter A1/2/3